MSDKNVWGGFEMVHLNEVKGVSFLGGNDFINSVEYYDWDKSQVDKDNDGNPDPKDEHYLEDNGVNNANRGRGIFSRLSSFMLRRGGNCYDQPEDALGTGGYECVGDVNTFEGFYAAISISEKQDIGAPDLISNNSVAITGTRFWHNSVGIFCYEKLSNLFINRCKIISHAEESLIPGKFLGYYKYFVKFKPQGILILSEIRNECEISDNKVYFLEKDAHQSWQGRSIGLCQMEDWKVNPKDDPDRVSCIAIRNLRNGNAFDARIYRNSTGMRNEDLNCDVVYSAIDLQANFSSLNLECNWLFVDFDRASTFFYPRHDMYLYHGHDTKSGYQYNIPDIGSTIQNAGNKIERDHTVMPDCDFWNNPQNNSGLYGEPRKHLYFPDGNQIAGSSFINGGTPSDVNYYRFAPNDITDPYCNKNPPGIGVLNLKNAPDHPCERSNPSNFYGSSTPVYGMNLYVVTDISTTDIEDVEPTSDLDDYPYEDGSATTYENENITAFVVHNWNNIEKLENKDIILTKNRIAHSQLQEVKIKGLAMDGEYDIAVFNVKGQIFYQGKYIPETSVFSSANMPITNGQYYLGLRDANGLINTFKIIVVD